MSEKILKALMRLFAIIAKADENTVDAKSVVESYLKQQLNKEQVLEYLAIYEGFLKLQDEGAQGEKKKRRLAVSSVKVIVICDQINEELTQKQKFIVLLNLIEFVSSNGVISEQEMEFIYTVSSSFKIPDDEFNQCLSLASKSTISEIEDSQNFLVISNQKKGSTASSQISSKANTQKLYSESIIGELAVLHINSIGIYLIRYYVDAELFLNGQIITPHKIYVLSQGSSIRSSKVQPIYYSDIVFAFSNDLSESKIVFAVNDIDFKFKSGHIGLHKLSFTENSGKLIGIMGGSGAGKSTLLNILNGNNTPSSGEVLVNGHDLHQDKKELEGVIGYIPQDDLLIEELTVYQNLFYNSKLCFDDYSDEKIDRMVIEMLNDLGLYETKDLKVGNSLDKTISGGQRKRLNIALELIREPSVLFVDEPTSGLSSRDSENIMDLLKELSLKGKLIFVVIHQPSSEIFKMFDKLLILDVGGYPIYNGNPVESVIYFKTLINQVNANESQCNTCGNVNPEQIFNIIESKVLDENGNQTRLRRISPKEWNEFYISKNTVNPSISKDTIKQPIKNTFKKPNFLNQFKVFTTRDVLSKLSNTQYLFINLLEAPLLALILATLIKYYKNNQNYLFSDNKNMPAYIFMCVIVSLFIGLTVSAEEIIRDRKILKRESFLNLSKGSYLTSKILILFFISAIQTITFVLIGNYILEIKGMYLDYWMVLFTASCFANMLGLNISSAFNSAVTIYILIPFLLIPQILLSGVIVKFEELNPKISSQSVVPFSGEIMTSRWAFEALAVNQFVNNKYEKQIYNYEKEISNASFKKVYWFSKMNDLADALKNKKEVSLNLEILKHEVNQEMKAIPEIIFASINKMDAGNIDENLINELKDYLVKVKDHYSQKYEKAVKSKDEWMGGFQGNDLRKAEYQQLLGNYQNSKIEDLLKNASSDLDEIVESDGKLIATGDPIYRDGPKDHFIRSHFFSPTKNVFGNFYSTYWVNIGVIWGMSFLLWLTLYFDVLRKILNLFAVIPWKTKK
ncbi:MAG: ATP-binding cassette domain-containing protein [Bacteroidota bacterium]|nr:ATP-binding cassette domain-containing protein [Bacteroidota bacterium]